MNIGHAHIAQFDLTSEKYDEQDYKIMGYCKT